MHIRSTTTSASLQSKRILKSKAEEEHGEMCSGKRHNLCSTLTTVQVKLSLYN
jgi:hypothetical protein